MKKYIPLLIITSLLLSACSFGNKEDLFEKKLECTKHTDQMLKILKDENGWKDSWINEIFYSPVNEDCYFIGYVTRNDNYINRYLMSFFNHKQVASFIPLNCDSIENSEEKRKCSDAFFENENQYQKIIKKLKGE